MKKVLFSLVVLCACMSFSCTKEKENQKESQCYSDRVIPLSSDTKESSYCFLFQSGHRRSECGGKCITMWGIPTHADGAAVCSVYTFEIYVI